MQKFKPRIPGFLTGLKIVIGNMFKTLLPFFENPNVNYPFEKEILAPRTRGVIALDSEACTSCMLCARSCPDWCIYIEGHKELQLPQNQEDVREAGQYSIGLILIMHFVCIVGYALKYVHLMHCSGHRNTNIQNFLWAICSMIKTGLTNG